MHVIASIQWQGTTVNDAVFNSSTLTTVHLLCPPSERTLHDDVTGATQTSKDNDLFFHVSPLFTYFCLSLFLLLFVNHISFVFCLICLPSANAFHPRVCGLQPLQPSGVQQPPAGRELRRLQQGNELIETRGEMQVAWAELASNE